MLDLNVYLSIYTHYLSPLMLQVSVIHNHVQVCVPDATLRDCESVGGCYLTLRDCESVGGCYLMPNELFFSYIMERISYIFILLFASVESIVLWLCKITKCTHILEWSHPYRVFCIILNSVLCIQFLKIDINLWYVKYFDNFYLMFFSRDYLISRIKMQEKCWDNLVWQAMVIQSRLEICLVARKLE